MARYDQPTPLGLDGEGRDESGAPDLPLTSIPSVPDNEDHADPEPRASTASTMVVGASLFVLIVAISVLGARYLKMPRSPLDVPKPVEEQVGSIDPARPAEAEALHASTAQAERVPAETMRESAPARDVAVTHDEPVRVADPPSDARPATPHATASAASSVLTQAPPPAAGTADPSLAAPARDSSEADSLRRDLAARTRALADARKEIERERGRRQAAEKEAADARAEAARAAKASGGKNAKASARNEKAEAPLDKKSRARLAALEKETAALRKENAEVKRTAEAARAKSQGHDADAAARDARAEAAEKRAKAAEAEVQEVRTSHEQALQGESAAVRKLVADLNASRETAASEKAARLEAERKAKALESELARARTSASAATSGAGSAAADRAPAPHTTAPRTTTAGSGSSAAGGATTTTTTASTTSTAPRTHETAPATSGAVSEPERLRTVPPYYPEDLRKARIGGRVLLRLLIDPAGRVSDVQVTRSPDPRLSELASAAAKRWTYTPGRKDGMRAQMWITEAVDFKL